MTGPLRSFDDTEKYVSSQFDMLPYLKAGKISSRDYIYAVIQLDSWFRRMEAAEAERDAIKKLFNAVKELIK